MCENVPRLYPEHWRQKNWLLHHDNAQSHTSFITRELLSKSKMTFIPTHLTFLFPWLKIKLKCCHFDTNEVTEAESQAVLNTLTEHDFQDAFKKCTRSTGSGKHYKYSTLVLYSPTAAVVILSKPCPT
jgi:hypothetical protein